MTIRTIARRGLLLAGLSLLIAATAQPARAEYPDRPVKIVLPLGPGGVGDISARILADKLGEKFGQRFIIENMPGVAGITAMRSVIAQANDGYTLMLNTGGIASSMPLFNKFPVDVLNDLTPVSSVGFFDCLLVTSEQSGFKTLGEFIAFAKANPGKLNIGTISAGGAQNLTANYFKQAAGIDVVIIPFKTTPETIIALMRNDVQMVVEFYAGLSGNLADGKLKPLAWAGSQPSPALPNLKTADAQGVKNFDAVSWNAIYVKTGTPPAIIATLNKAIGEVIADPVVKKKFLDLGVDARAGTPAEIDAKMRSDIQKWAKVIDGAGIPKQ
jgi:tripartite-type tricarboxylate transporter receptor subunit TctC